MVGHRIGVCGRRLNPPSSMANAYVSMASSRPPQRNELEAGNDVLVVGEIYEVMHINERDGYYALSGSVGSP